MHDRVLRARSVGCEGVGRGKRLEQFAWAGEKAAGGHAGVECGAHGFFGFVDAVKLRQCCCADELRFRVGRVNGDPGVGKLQRSPGLAVEDFEKLTLAAALVVEVRRTLVEHAPAPLVLAAVVGVRRVAFVGVGWAELAEVLAAGVAGFAGGEFGGAVVGWGGYRRGRLP